MTDTPTPQTDNSLTEESSATPPTTLMRCLSGSVVAAGLGWAAYGLTYKIAANFAAHPFQSQNYIAVNISVAVRTLVVGLFALATAVFSIIALGLMGLGIQILVQKIKNTPSAS